MAISSATAWEVRTAGNDTNGGGFVPGSGGTDYSQQDAKNTAGNNISTADAVANGTTTITSATASFTAAIEGNIVYFQGGSGAIAAVRRQVTAFANSTTIEVDAAIAASTGMTMNIGGALGSPGEVGVSKVAGNDVHIKSGTYTLTTGTANVSGGRVNETTGGVDSANISRWEGYGSTRGDKGTKPKILVPAAGVTSITIFIASGNHMTVDNIEVDGAGKTSITGIDQQGTYQRVLRCKASNCTVKGILINNNGGVYAWACQVTGCSGTCGFEPGTLIDCEAYDNTTVGFLSGGGVGVMIRCIADSNTGASSDGFGRSSVGYRAINCASYGNGRHGFATDGSGNFGGGFINCIAEGNGGWGWFTDASSPAVELLYCAGYNNTSGNYNSAQITAVVGFVTSSATFFVDAPNGNFALNNTAGGGADARAAGYPGLMPRGLSTFYNDIGVGNHADPASAAGVPSDWMQGPIAVVSDEVMIGY